jgi:hypothetical protein
MTPLQAAVAYNRPGEVGASSIYQATVALRMIETSQNTYRRPVPPATVIHIDLTRFNELEIR